MVKKETDSADRREKILSAAKKLFAQNGYDAVSTRDIVELAGVNISLIKYYFDGKEGLYRECLELAGMAVRKLTGDYLTEAKSIEEFRLRLRMYAEHFLEDRFANYEAFLLTERELNANSKIFKELLEKTYLQTFENIGTYFELAQKNGFVRKELHAFQLANMLQGMLERELRVEHARKSRFNFSLAQKEVREFLSAQIVDVLCHGVCPHTETR